MLFLRTVVFFYFYSVTIVCIFSPSLHPTPANPTSLPHLYPPPWFCPCVLYSSSCRPLSLNCGLFEILLLTQWCSVTVSLAQGLWVIWGLSFSSRIWVKKGRKALVCLRCFVSWGHEVSHWVDQYPAPCSFKEWAPEQDTSGDFQLCHPPLWAHHWTSPWGFAFLARQMGLV